MLIESPIKVTDVITIKTLSGDEVVARLSELRTDCYTLTKPMTFMMGPQGLGLIPFVFSAQNSKIDIMKTNVLCAAKTDAEVAKQYLSQTSQLSI